MVVEEQCWENKLARYIIHVEVLSLEMVSTALARVGVHPYL